ncbi:MAG TPA: YMGG-like glycine zipper-containing protein, partial [Candidatus Sulfopaludibacter sp.]|nr:YMGG-like glycine zipper-containing protein [Candidatus Sulfopaludibacter sp.]
ETAPADDSASARRGGDAPQILRPDSEPTANSTPATVAQSAPREIPAGTNIVVRMIDGVDSERDTVGKTFQASVDQPITIGGETVIPRGADVVVKLVDDKEAGKLTGRAELTLALVSIKYQGRLIDVNTQSITRESDARGKSTAKKAGIGAAAGAVLGAVLGGGKGAAVGAAAGGATGAGVEAMSSGPHVKVPSETRLTFVLDNAVTI